MFPVQFLLVSLALSNFAATTPLPKIDARAPPEIPGLSRRGVAYNKPEYVKHFDAAGSHVTW